MEWYIWKQTGQHGNKNTNMLTNMTTMETLIMKIETNMITFKQT